MKITVNIFFLLGLLATALAQALDNRYIVMLQRGSDIDAYLDKISAVGDVEEVLRWHGASIFYGVVVRSLSHTLESLGAYPEVEYVEPDQIVTIPGCPVEPCTIMDELEEKDRRAAAMAVEWNT